MAKTSKADITSLIPIDSPVFGVVDSRWGWDATAPVREYPDVSKEVAKTEKELGISFDKDVAPWAGNIGVIMLDMKKEQPSFAFLVEITDEDKFEQVAKKLGTVAERESKLKWTDVTYNGVKMRRATLNDRFGAGVPITTAVIKGYVLIGAGANTAERVIDTAQGKKPSIEKMPAMTQALATLPEKPVSWFGINGEEYFKLMTKQSPVPMSGDKILKLSGYVGIYSVTENTDEIRMKCTYIATNDTVQSFWKDIKSKTAPVKGDSLKQLPATTFIAAVTTNPSVWWDQYKKIFTSIADQSGQQMAIQQSLEQIKPVENVIKRMNGECALACTYQQKQGFGVVILGETQDKKSAADGARELQQFVSTVGVNAVQKGSLYQLPQTKFNFDQFKGMVCWSATDNWLKLSSSPVCISGTSSSKLELSDEAIGSDFAAAGNFAFLPMLLKEISGSKEITEEDVDAIQTIGFNKAEWQAWGTIDLDGKSSHSELCITNWDWRKALAAGLDYAKKKNQ